MTESERIIEVLRERKLCDVCADSSDENCCNCKNVKGTTFSEITGSFNAAIEALQEKAERDKGCEYCNRELADYQHTHTTKLSINTFGKARTLNTECDPCPPYANCCMKNIPARSVFIINYCPNCGRKLGDKEGKPCD